MRKVQILDIRNWIQKALYVRCREGPKPLIRSKIASGDGKANQETPFAIHTAYTIDVKLRIERN